MFSIHWKLANALVLAFVFAVAMSATSAEAQSTRKKQVNRSATAGNQYVYQPRAYRARAYYRGPARRGEINYRSRSGANWNRNQ